MRGESSNATSSTLGGWAFPNDSPLLRRMPSTAPTVPYAHDAAAEDDEYQCGVDDAGFAVWEVELPFGPLPNSGGAAPSSAASTGARVHLRLSTVADAAPPGGQQRQQRLSGNHTQSETNGTSLLSPMPPSSKRRRVTWRVSNALGQSVMENESILELPEFETLDDSMMTSTRDRALASGIAAALEADAMQQTTPDVSAGGDINSAFERHLAGLVAASYRSDQPVPLLLTSDPVQLAKTLRARNQMRRQEFAATVTVGDVQTNNLLTPDAALRRSSALSVASLHSSTSVVERVVSLDADSSTADMDTEGCVIGKPSSSAEGCTSQAAMAKGKGNEDALAVEQGEVTPLIHTTPAQVKSCMQSFLIRYFGDVSESTH